MSLFTPTAEASHGPEINSFFISKVVSKLHMFCHHQYQGFNSMIVSIIMNLIFISVQKRYFPLPKENIFVKCFHFNVLIFKHHDLNVIMLWRYFQACHVTDRQSLTFLPKGQDSL